MTEKHPFFMAVSGELIGDGRVVHRGGSIAFLEGTLSNDAGEMVATATSTARIVRMPAS
jgi:acyl-coenzyme A thioesterase PaaI-like protein